MPRNVNALPSKLTWPVLNGTQPRDLRPRNRSQRFFCCLRDIVYCLQTPCTVWACKSSSLPAPAVSRINNRRQPFISPRPPRVEGMLLRVVAIIPNGANRPSLPIKLACVLVQKTEFDGELH